ncbi:MAG: hypothetical protein B6242_10460 [Anaerolineaceae bacterium 4572_78]|nr:MAG: hypothetical protein B6242_10460 [Anaerolineaceae bacterium 4572_78]
MPVVWDYDELLTFAEGNIADVFGKEYASIDTYKVRVRLPTPPYLLVSRVTDIKAKLGEYKPSFVQTEYDIPHNSWYTVDGQAPWAVAVESGQCDLLLISYIGIDLQNKGERMYRLLDCTLTFVDELPYEGQTLRYDIYIDSYARSGDILLFFFRYDCYADDKKVLIMQGGSAGFFSQKELDEGKGIIVTKEELEERAKIPKQHFTPLLHTNKTRFNRADIVALSHGNIAACFGSHYDQKGHNPSLRLPPEKMLMVDRITQLDFHGGPWGLGMMIAEKDIAPDDWYFPCHFMDDAVLAGSLMAEGCLQMMQAYMLSIGLQHATKDARFQPIPNLKQIVRCRGQVIPTYDTMEYRLEVKEIGLDPNPYSIANVDIIFENKIVVRFENLGVQLVEKERVRSQELGVRSQEQQRLLYHEVVAQWTPRHALYTEEQLIEFSEGSIVKCFGSEYQIYETKRCPRTPNGDLQLISRIVELNAERYNFKSKSSLVSEYDVPVNPWYCEQNNYPMPPYSILMEMALQPCGFLSAYLGSTLPYPDEDFYFRNLDGTGELLREMDIRGKTVSNKVTFISSTFFSGIILQKYEFELSCDGQAFYKGVTTFGYFTKEALKNQVGLDGGNYKSPYHETATGKRYTINLLSQETPPLQICGVEVWFPKQLDFLDKVIVMPNGGKFGKGYVFAESMIDPEAWFFKAHFYLDPVMPGSLGVEAILQALQAYALQQDLGQQMNSPRFGHVENHTTVWKYRGQISHERHQMYLEVHIKEINQTPDMITIIGEASLWKKGMRIYEVKDIAICIREG